MNNDLYNMIFKRKSFHLFRNIGDEHITSEGCIDSKARIPDLRRYESIYMLKDILSSNIYLGK